MSDQLNDLAAYVRRSTEEQEDQHQIDDVKDYLEYQDVDQSHVSWYVEQASGADPVEMSSGDSSTTSSPGSLGNPGEE